ncbi:MAG: TonB-dependent receptor [Acidobacteria bacterium]|nr:TonB-dependent receptor [Acidobacteriota bacterium]MBI3424230.1 TonB-dependent receptor [Acidobacteriota bacterium]
MKFKTSIWQLFFALIVTLSLLSAATAQTSRGTVSGTVSDSAGAVIPSAKVELVNNGTGIVRSTTTNEAGIFRFDAVDLGGYTLKFTAQGFKQLNRTNINVQANQTATIDAALAVGVTENVVEVNATADELLIKDAPIRGGSISAQAVSQLPVSGLEPISIARTLPGVVQAVGTSTFGNGGQNTQFSVNGQRPRGNNYLLDGTENNDISVGGNAQSFNMTDAVQEVSVQTSNFGSEFGRAGGGVFNVITKGGTNQYHGTAYDIYRSQRFSSVSNTAKINGTPKSVFNENFYGFTAGGPIVKNKTFIFGGWQKDPFRSTNNFSFVVPTADTVTRLNTLFPNNPRLKLYLDALGDLRGTANPINLALGLDPATNVDRGSVSFASANTGLATPSDDIQWVTRVDHNLSEAHRLSFRYIYDSSRTSPNGVNFPGYIFDFKGRSQNFLFNDTYTLSSTWTNEFRFGYSRIGFDFPISGRSTALASTLPTITIPNIAAPGIQTNIPQFRYANNWLIQETQSKIVGRHTFRYGLEFLRQLAKQHPPFVERGALSYANATGYSGFANFLDDFSGPSGTSNKNFGPSVYYPNLFRQSYFFQDTWKVDPTLTLTLGLRYENFGQPANGAFKYPAFNGFDPAQFTVPNKVNTDNNNFGPSIGLAWTPNYKVGVLRKLFGEGKTVWRSGFQVSYDTFFNNLLSNIAADSPNTVNTIFTGAGTGRGSTGFFNSLPTVARAPIATDSQTSVFDKNVRNPYTERWSLGFQRELPSKLLLDVSYVGAGAHKLFVTEDLNIRKLDGTRLFPLLGIRRQRASEGNSIYHGLQILVDRRFANSFNVTGAYTYSRAIDNTSEVFATANSVSALSSLPVSQGGLKLDRGLSDYHRGQRFVLSYQWSIPGPKNKYLAVPLAGWRITGISTFQSGTPFTIVNGADRNNDGNANDRPDIGNPNAPINTRAVIAPTTGANSCASGYRNPDALTLTCVTPNDVHWIQGTGLPNASTVGRNTLITKGQVNTDMNILKSFRLTESFKLEYRLETFNIFNHPQFVQVPGASVVGTAGPSTNGLPSRFLNLDYTNSGTRTMRMQLKFIF